jgi:hypothetical protein
MEKLIQTKWYEVAFSYIKDGGTETIESFHKLDDAKKFAKNYKKEEYMEFLFIDKWTCDINTSNDYPFGHAEKVKDFKALIYKNNKIK